jgi:hypothetical protein
MHESLGLIREFVAIYFRLFQGSKSEISGSFLWFQIPLQPVMHFFIPEN